MANRLRCVAIAQPSCALGRGLVQHGIEQGFDPGPPITGNAYDQTEIRTPFWREAIAAFMGSEFIREQFGTSFQHIYGQQKLKEMHSFYTEVTDLEYAWYLRSV